MILASACLIGVKCRYDGETHIHPKLVAMFERGEIMPVCPEVLGGLPIPRESCEIIKDGDLVKVISKSGIDRTAEFTKGAQVTLEICQALGIKKAVLKTKSPSCGCGKIYNGTFTRTLIDGNGFAAQLLLEAGVEVLGEDEI